jgi:hypothetical protein
LIDAAIHLTRAIKKDTDRPALAKSSCCCTDRFSITRAPLYRVGTAGANDVPQNWDPEQLGFGHKCHRTAQGVAKKGWVEMGSVIRDYHQGTLKWH